MFRLKCQKTMPPALLTLFLFMFFSGYALAGGGPADPTPKENPMVNITVQNALTRPFSQPDYDGKPCGTTLWLGLNANGGKVHKPIEKGETKKFDKIRNLEVAWMNAGKASGAEGPYIEGTATQRHDSIGRPVYVKVKELTYYCTHTGCSITPIFRDIE